MAMKVLSIWSKRTGLFENLNSLVYTRLLLAVVIAFYSVTAQSLTLSEFSVKSFLDKPLEGSISVAGNSGDNLNSLVVSLASPKEFEQAGIKRTSTLDNLQFKVENKSKQRALIVVSSGDQPISDPYIHVLLKLSWNGGQLLREFTALIDPPLYSSEQPNIVDTVTAQTTKQVDQPKQVETKPASTPLVEPVTTEQETAQKPIQEPTQQTIIASTPRLSADGSYGPVVAGDSLSMIAKDIQSQYQDLSIYQIMLALHRNNSNAFIDNNINGLIKGSVLQLGDIEEARKLSKSESVSFFFNQVAAWETQDSADIAKTEDDTIKVSSESADSQQQSSSAKTDTASGTSTSNNQQENPEFQVSASDLQESAASQEQQGKVVADLQSKVADLEASFESAKLENKELKETIAILENQLADSARMIELSNQALAALQEQSEAVTTEVQPEPQTSESQATDTQTPAITATEQEITQPKEVVSPEAQSEQLEAAKPTQVPDTGVSQPEENKLGEIAAEPKPAEQKPEQETVIEQPRQPVETPKPVQPVVTKPEPQPTLVDKVMGYVNTAIGYVSDYWRYLLGLGGVLLIGLLISRLRGGNSEEEYEASFTDYLEEEQDSPEDEADRADAETQTASETKEGSSTISSIDMNALREATQSVSDFEISETNSSETTKESSFLTVYNDGDVVVNADEIDPIAEADVYIAYGREDQGEEVLLEGLKNFPERSDIKVKLLQLYLNMKNRDKFDDIYGQLAASGLEKNIDEWQNVEDLRRSMNQAVPRENDEMPAVAATSQANMPSMEETLSEDVSLTNDSEELSDQLDFDITVSSIAEELSESLSQEMTMEVSEIDEEVNYEPVKDIEADSLLENDSVIEADSLVEDESVIDSPLGADLSQSEVDFSNEMLTEQESVDIDMSEQASVSEAIDISAEMTEVDFSDDDQQVEVAEAMEVDLSELDLDSAIDFSAEKKPATEKLVLDTDNELEFVDETGSTEEVSIDIDTADGDTQPAETPQANNADDGSLSIELDEASIELDAEVSVDFGDEIANSGAEDAKLLGDDGDIEVTMENDLDAIDLNFGDDETTNLPDGVSDPVTQLDLAKVFLELEDVAGAVKILKELQDDPTVGAEAKELLSKHA